MKNIKLSAFLFLLFIITSCSKEETNINKGGGSDSSNNCYSELTSQDIPTLGWMLEGNISDYVEYNDNVMFTFGSPWLANYTCGGAGKIHSGWDIHTANITDIVNKEVYSIYDGVVKYVYYADSDGTWGQGVVIEHNDLNGNKFSSTYIHIDPVSNLIGTSVGKGQLIGYVMDYPQDSQGNDWDHLHFSIRKSSVNGSNTSKRGALPLYQNDNTCECLSDPVFPEYFINPNNLNFSVNTPFQPSPNKINPSNNQTDLTNPILFNWQNMLGDAVYRIQISKSKVGWNSQNGFAVNNNLIVNENTNTANQYQWNLAEANQEYWWSIRTFKNGVTSDYSEPYRFTTADVVETRIMNLTGNLDFGTVDVGTTESRTLNISNTGNSALHITNIILPSVGGYGYSTNGNGNSFYIQPNQSVDITITFTPQSTSSYNGTIVIYSDKTSGVNQINTYAQGNEINTKIINLYPSGGISYFGLGVQVGVTSTKSFNIKNTGNSTLQVTSIDYPYSVFSTVGSDNITVGPNQIVTLEFDFTPNSTGNYDGDIVVNSDATSGDNTISISNANGI